MKRYKKSLLESEKAIAELRQELGRSGKDRDSNYTNDRRSEEEARLREDLQQKLEAAQAELERVCFLDIQVRADNLTNVGTDR